MSHQISYCEITPQEIVLLGQSARMGLRGWVDDLFMSTLIFSGVFFMGAVLAAGVAWLGRKVGSTLPGEITAGIPIAASVLGVLVAAPPTRALRRARRTARQDILDRRVEVTRVEGARVVELEEYNDEGPLYYFDIGAGKILLGGGQWLYDLEVYGLNADEASLESDDRWPFPSSTPGAILSRKRQLPAWLRHHLRHSAPTDSFMVDGDFTELLESAGSRHTGGRALT